MKEPDSFNQLISYLQKQHLNYESHISEKRFYFAPSDPILNTKYVIFKKNDFTFCAYDSHATKAGSTQTFTGIYCPIELKPEMELEITRKHWSDAVLMFNKRKTGIDAIDQNLTIKASGGWNFQVLFAEKEAHLFAETEKQIRPLKLVIQYNYLPFISELKGKQVIGLQTNQWIHEEAKLECFLNSGTELIEKIRMAGKRIFGT